MKETTKHKIFLGLATLVFIWSAIGPKDYLTWSMEVAPAVIGFFILYFTYDRFRLSTLLYGCIALHAIILMVGGHYTYAEVPLFNWFKDIGLFARNNYDKVGHLAQGFFPSLVAREIFIRTSPLKPGKWLNFVIICAVLAISALYELIEWAGALIMGDAATDFLGTQGYIWDTQSDMWYALIGGILALLLFSKIHDRAMEKIK
jgi:putative membrane protein